MNCVRRHIPLRTKLFFGKRLFSNLSNSKDLSEDENKKLYNKLMSSTFNEKTIEASSFAKFLTPDNTFGPPRIMNYDWSVKSMVNWFRRKRVQFHKLNQRYTVERVKALGSDIAAAHFIVYRGGSIRFCGHDNFIQWTDKKEEYFTNLPQNYDSNYYVEAIDASYLMLYYQGMENFKNLYKLKWLNLSNNPVLDNWCLDYIGHAIPHLEYLNISNCPQVTAGGIAGLQKVNQLKELVIDSDNIEVQMACFALEDVIPGLFVSINDKNDVELSTKEKQLNVNKLQKVT